MLPEQAQNALDGWITAAAPVVKKLYGETETEWPEVRRQYMHGMLNLFPAIRGVSYNTTMLGSTPLSARRQMMLRQSVQSFISTAAVTFTEA